MLRLAAFAHQQSSQEMSLFRRLITYGRLLLKNHQQILLGRSRKVPENNNNGVLRIENKHHQSGRGPSPFPRAASELGGGGIREASSSSSSGSAWCRIGSQIHSQVRQIFINNVLRRATSNQEVARRAAQRLLYGDSRPFFALVGVSLATGGAGVVSKDNGFDEICWEIRESITGKTATASSSSEEGGLQTDEQINSVDDLRFGPILNQGCNAAVYAANHKNSETNDWPLAVKMMFNYDIESNAFAILKAMVKEIVPARSIDLKSLCDLDQALFDNMKKCPPHQNVIDVQRAFVDRVPMLPQSLENYPSALPRRLNPDDGLGRNMSLFLVMKRYDGNLQEYLKSRPELTYRTRLLILTQLLCGVAHLERNQIAHRDLKTDNILVDMSQGEEFPEVVISDFGCCLADKTHGLSLPFRTTDTDRGGNPALCAPEIATAVPGIFKYLNYHKSDVWTIGAIAYELFGNRNPFYRSAGSQDRLDSRTYKESDIPVLENVNINMRKLIGALLKRNPDERLSAEKAFNICICLLWAPSDWLSRTSGRYPNDDEILQWLVCLTAKALCHSEDQLEFKIMRNFLRYVKFSVLKSAVMWIAQTREE